MKFDTIIIGGGMAGLSCALRCLEAGLKTAVIASGQSALHFSSGSIDVLAMTPNGEQVSEPFTAIGQFTQQFPTHPYAMLGKELVSTALHWYQNTLTRIGVPLTSLPNGENHYRLTPLGSMKSTWLSQPFVYKFPLSLKDTSRRKIVMITLDGFRDFQPKLAQDNLKQLSAFADIEITTATVTLPGLNELNRNHCELRSIDLSRLLAKAGRLYEFAYTLQNHANPGDLVVIPSIFGNGKGLAKLKEIEQLTGFSLCEVPTMPPSLLGIRLEEMMKHAFIEQGGTLLSGDHVTGGEFSLVKPSAPGHRTQEDTVEQSSFHLERIYTHNHGDFPLQAKQFVLATGSFFSQGLKASANTMVEPIFNLDLNQSQTRTQWYNPQFFSKQSHPFLSMGVKTTPQLKAIKESLAVENLYCAGAILSGYNPILEGSGSGVAISSGFHAAQSIITELKPEFLEQKESQEVAL